MSKPESKTWAELVGLVHPEWRTATVNGKSRLRSRAADFGFQILEPHGIVIDAGLPQDRLWICDRGDEHWQDQQCDCPPDDE